jgi:hypothetical protein
MIDQRELLDLAEKEREKIQAEKYYEKFSPATWDKLTSISTSIFQNFK